MVKWIKLKRPFTVKGDKDGGLILDDVFFVKEEDDKYYWVSKGRQDRLYGIPKSEAVESFEAEVKTVS